MKQKSTTTKNKGEYANLLACAWRDFKKDDVIALAAALSFYLTLALAPLVILLITFANTLPIDTQYQIVNQVAYLMGPSGEQILSSILKNAQEAQSSPMSVIISSIFLLITASGTFLQLQHSMNKVWAVPPPKKKGLRNWFAKRTGSILLLIIFGLISIASLLIFLQLKLLVSHSGIGGIVQFILSWGLFTVLIATLFRVIPDAQIAWKDVWTGSVVSAFFFIIGQYALGLYLQYRDVGSAYGTAGSIIVLLVWIYYSSIIFFFGAELTQAYAETHGSGIIPNK